MLGTTLFSLISVSLFATNSHILIALIQITLPYSFVLILIVMIVKHEYETNFKITKNFKNIFSKIEQCIYNFKPVN